MGPLWHRVAHNYLAAVCPAATLCYWLLERRGLIPRVFGRARANAHHAFAAIKAGHQTCYGVGNGLRKAGQIKPEH